MAHTLFWKSLGQDSRILKSEWFKGVRESCFVAALVCLLVAAPRAIGATYTVPAFDSNSIQTTIYTAYGAGPNNTVYLPAGNYNISQPIQLPCDNNLTITGPNAQPATAVLNASFSNQAILNASACAGLTIQYLQFANTGGVYIGAASASNILITHNQFYNLPSAVGNGMSSFTAVFVDGTIDTTVTNFTATFNTFGDGNSCTAVFANMLDQGGYCAGIFAQAGILVNAKIQYNTFYHVEEGIHFHQFCTDCQTGDDVSVTQNASIQYNYLLNFHRIGIEMQAAVIGMAMVVSDNVLALPLNPYYGTMFISDACCTTGRTFVTSTPPDPANLTENNLIYGPGVQVGTFVVPVYGIEYWGGAGSQASNNFIMGGFSNQIAWGYGSPPWYVENNYLCGAVGGSYIVQAQQSTAPIIANNTEVATCTQQVSAGVSISPASGSSANAGPVTLTTSGRNTSIYYTTDGSTPVPGAGTTKLYTGPFTMTQPGTVTALGMWGVLPQPYSYPAPWGFVPSALTRATYTAAGNPTLTGITLTTTYNTHTVVAGQTLQFSAYGVYSDGSTAPLGNPSGDNSILWNTSNHTVGKVSTLGHFTALMAGTVGVTAQIKGLSSSPTVITVTPASSSTGGATLTGITLKTTYNNQSVVAGGTLQFSAYGAYSDGSVKPLTDTSGDNAVLWNTSNHAVAKISTLGHLTAVKVGTVGVTAQIKALSSPPTMITVTPASAASSGAQIPDAKVTESLQRGPRLGIPRPRSPHAPVVEDVEDPLKDSRHYRGVA